MNRSEVKMKIKLGVIFGGQTVEHEVSIISALQAIGNLNKDKYDVIPVYIAKDRTFYTGDILTEVDTYYNSPDFVPREYTCYETNLEQLCDRFRFYAANNPDRPWRHLYYDIKTIRLFFSSFATTRLIILRSDSRSFL